MSRALTVDEALSRILAGAEPITDVEARDLLSAHGAVLAEPLSARLTQPPFDASAMDGYAVRATDVVDLPARLVVIGEAAAGHGFAGSLGSGQAARIFTGAPLPTGADAIVIQENTTRDGTIAIVTTGKPDPEHIRPRGGDFRAGETLLPAGRRLTARDVTLAAAMGHAGLAVRRPPVVAILATGDELVPPGIMPGPDQIVCSNTYGIAGLVRAAGGAPQLLGIAEDTSESLAAHVERAAGADILVTVGGASVGDHDLVAPVLTRRGMAVDFWKIAMRPGKPLMYGRLGRQHVLGLPGNPVSSLVCSRLFLVPLIRALLGLEPEPQRTLEARAAVPLEANGARAHYMRAVTKRACDGMLEATPLPNQDSSLMRPLAAADCLLVRPISAPALPAGAVVPILMLDF
ncbi:MAG: molybdopterin molybdotransferase MoeA [Hyphomicrobiaceae bacterium]|nr:molybdopterin molybdotransferase MoeA [Hyphomicrobiaceae bacterium]